MSNESRQKERVEVQFSAEFRGRRVRGQGLVKNISESGALIDNADPLIMEGGRIRVRFSFFEDSVPIEIPAVVTRETPTGFGVRFSDMEPRLRRLLSVAISRAKSRIEELEGMPGDDDGDKTLTSLF
jgi:hypothetical protein